MTHYIYKTTNTTNKKYYIGVHTTKSGLVSNYNGTENKMIPKTEPIHDGWVKGLLRGNKK